MSATVTANDGTMLPIDSLAVIFEYDGAFISKATVIYESRTYEQTYINDGTNIIQISQWELFIEG